MLHLHTSNRYEFLRAQLLDDLAVGMKGMSAPFAAQEVIIPSAGIRRDVELALAERLGICASVRFPFLAQWLWDRMAQFTPVQETLPFAPVRLMWQLRLRQNMTNILIDTLRIKHKFKIFCSQLIQA